MINLVYNEQLKLFRKKRLLVIVFIIICLVSLLAYGQYRQMKTAEKQIGSGNWRVQLQEEITDIQNRMNTGGGGSNQALKIRAAQDQYYLDHNINPKAPGAPTFLRLFIENALGLLLPLLVMVAASDIVSSEAGGGTIKLLLTRPVRRWKILLSKYIALLLSTSFIIFCSALFGYLISGAIFGYKGWTLPMLTGFSTRGTTLVTTHAHLIPLWRYLLIEFGLAWFVCAVIGAITLTLSVMIRSTAAVMGIMLAALIAGTILAHLASSWTSAKYLFVINLQLTDYINGTNPPIEGMTLGFSLSVLLAWMAASVACAFAVFCRKDMY